MFYLRLWTKYNCGDALAGLRVAEREEKMNSVVDDLTNERKILEEIIIKAEQSLKMAPQGMLRVSKSGNSEQYYRREDEKDKNGKYIKKKNIELIHGLAQKDYDEAVLKMAKVQKDRIDKFLKQYKPGSVMDVYDNLTQERQRLIEPYILPEEQYVRLWESKKYSGKGFSEDAPEIYTEKGERVRSKSEKILADKFKLMNIPYLYECPLQLKGYGIVYPDFTLLNRRTRKEYYLEHFGRMDDAEYCESTVRKIECYEKNGIYPGEKLLMSYETSKIPLDMRAVERMIQKYLT